MKLWKKICLKGIAFAMIFLTILAGVQNVLRYKGESAEDLLARYDSYRDQTAAGMEIDVLYMGSSPVYAGIAPMVMWEDCGYTGMNLGTSTQNAMSVYYSLLDVLEFADPSVVVLDFVDLAEMRAADNMDYYYSYRKTIDTLQSPRIKWQMLFDVVKSTGSMEHIFTISRFHDRWDSLTAQDLGQEVNYYNAYTKGALMNEKVAAVALTGAYDVNTEPKEYCEFSLEYYRKIISICREKGIQIVAFTPPTAKIREYMADYTAVRRFCDENDIPYLDYNDPELQQQIALDFNTDFYDREHLNADGSVKLSRLLSAQLDQLCDLPDRREDPAYASWNDDLAAFRERYMEQA